MWTDEAKKKEVNCVENHIKNSQKNRQLTKKQHTDVKTNEKHETKKNCWQTNNNKATEFIIIFFFLLLSHKNNNKLKISIWMILLMWFSLLKSQTKLINLIDYSIKIW